MIQKLVEIKDNHPNGEGSSGGEKREFFTNFLKQNPWVKRIGEIGFNCGLSAYTFLETREDITVQSFDICQWGYTEECFNILHEKYGDRILLKKGDSKITVPKYSGEKFDMIFIDGDHTFEGCSQDIRAMRKHAHKNTVVLIDDFGLNKKFSYGVTGAILVAKYYNYIKFVNEITEGIIETQYT